MAICLGDHCIAYTHTMRDGRWLCDRCARLALFPELVAELSHLVSLLEPLEKDGGLQVPGLATLNGARSVLARAKELA